MRSYDTTLYPPGPVVAVRLTHPATDEQSSPIRGRLDTGAGVTVIPEGLPVQLGLMPQGQIWTTSFDGSRTKRDVYYVGVRMEGFAIASVPCVVARRNDVLLGRNVLNQFLIILDGRNLAFDLRDA
ncbi:MAG: hypothetical protein FJ291_18540 [Planctomycetes bacterium]|nr:hypothetical protein [Planctomycetota bacterium]